MKKWLVLFGLLLLTGCSQVASPAARQTDVEASTPYGNAPVKDTEGVVLAEAVVEPARWVVLRAQGNGAIYDIGAQEGDSVAAGDVLLHVDSTDAQLAVQRAQAALVLAQARRDLVAAGVRPEQVAILEAQLAAAEAGVSQAAALRTQQSAGGTEADIAAAQAQVAAANAAHSQADEAHDETLQCVVADLPDGSERKICPALGTFEEISRFQMEAAYASLVAAQTQLEAIQGTASAERSAAQAGVQIAAAQRDAAQAQLELARAGSRAEAVTAAEAEVQQAEAALAMARALLEDCELKAPFEGTVTDIAAQVGDTATPGTELMTLATLEHLQIKTKDLTELDVVHISVGHPAVVTLDARSEHPLAAHVSRIEQQGQEYLGDMTYAVYIELDGEMPAWLRWGMTAQVEIRE